MASNTKYLIVNNVINAKNLFTFFLILLQNIIGFVEKV